MARFRIVYILSLVLLGMVVIGVIYRPVTTDTRYSEVQRDQLLEKEDQWILQFDIVNQEKHSQDYLIKLFINDAVASEETVTVMDGKKFSYVYHVYRSQLPDGRGKIGFMVFKSGETRPVESATYYLK